MVDHHHSGVDCEVLLKQQRVVMLRLLRHTLAVHLNLCHLCCCNARSVIEPILGLLILLLCCCAGTAIAANPPADQLRLPADQQHDSRSINQRRVTRLQ